MTIARAAESTRLTKKAIRYYESAGLIEPEILDNGYREYSDEIIKQLILIKTLRSLYFSIDEICICLKDKDRLLSCFSSKTRQLQDNKEQLSMIIELINQFINQRRSIEDISEFQTELEILLQDRPMQLRILLAQSFPGDFGEILAAAYGQFLNEPLSSAEQIEAWEALVNELDEIETITIPEALLSWAQNKNNREQIHNNYLRLKEEYNQSYEDFSHDKRDAIQNHLDMSETNTSPSPGQDLAIFMSTDGKPAAEAFGKYLPILSKQFQQFFIKQSRFLHDNPELVEKLKKEGMGF